MNITRTVLEFHTAFGCRIAEPVSPELLTERIRLIEEEYRELIDELYAGELNPARTLKECADLVYVVAGLCVNLGWDLDAAVRIVHESNMSKMDANGRIRIDAFGKVLKPDTYVTPDVSPALKGTP